MRTEEIRYGTDGLLAVIIHNVGDEKGATEAYISSGISFVTSPEEPMQVGVMNRPGGYEVKRHVHLPMKREIVGTSETLIVISGLISVTIYSSDREWVDSKTLQPGDVIVLLKGGHSVSFLTASRIMEVKQGPYLHGDDKGGW